MAAGCSWFDPLGAKMAEVDVAVEAGDRDRLLSLLDEVVETWPESDEARWATEEIPRTLMGKAEALAGDGKFVDAAETALRAWERQRTITPDGKAALAAIGATSGTRGALFSFGGFMSWNAAVMEKKTLGQALMVGDNGSSMDGFSEAVVSWACEHADELHGYAACVAAGTGSLEDPSEIEAALEACDGWSIARFRCPNGGDAVDVIAEAVAKVEAADAAWFKRIEPEVQKVEGEIEASARRWASIKAERSRIEARYLPGVAVGRRSAMEAMFRAVQPVVAREERQREVDEALCDRIRGMAWPRDTKEREADRLEAVSDRLCVIR